MGSGAAVPQGTPKSQPPGPGTAGRRTKHQGCLCTCPRLTPQQCLLLLSHSPHCSPSMQQELGPTSSTRAGWGTRGRAGVAALCHPPGQSSTKQPRQHLGFRHSSLGTGVMPIIPADPKHRHQQCDFCCQYQLESATDNVPEQVSNV